MNTRPPTRRPSEQGYILVGVMFMLALLIIAMAVAVPKIAKSIQRDRELETMHRGKQYARAVKLYYKQFGAYPPNIDALVKTNEIRFLRKKYVDPTTGKDEWKPVRLGQNKAPTAMGFFGVPLSGVGMGGGPCGSAQPSSITSSLSSSTFSSGTSGGVSSSLAGSSGCPTGSSGSTTSTFSTDTTATSSATDPNSNNGSAPPGSGTGGAAASPGSATASAFGTPSGQTFGGPGIIGFSPQNPKQSIFVYKKKNHYNEWEFVYDPIAEQMMTQGGNIGGGLGGTGNGITGSPQNTPQPQPQPQPQPPPPQ